MIDCGEGAQVQLRRMHLRFTRLNHVFISHLHGDHCFGLPGLISTLGMLGRKGDLHLYGPPGLDEYLRPILERFAKGLGFQVVFHIFDPGRSELILEDASVSVRTIPLTHRVPAAGFLFSEKPKAPHLLREMIDFYQIPIRCLADIKKGMDYCTPEGEIVPNRRLTRPAEPPKRYAYCSDTAFRPDNAALIQGVDLLYHEATFLEADEERANETRHSTAAQAGEMARIAGVKQLLIGHFSARYEDEEALRTEAAAHFPNVLLAKEGLLVPL
jgi:ribonuclease Z